LIDIFIAEFFIGWYLSKKYYVLLGVTQTDTQMLREDTNNGINRYTDCL
jgi:hypothetical protein